MIERWRNTSKQWISKAILGLVLASFVLWGMGGLILQSKKNHVADVGNHFVTAAEFAQQLKSTIVGLEQQHNQKMSAEMIDESGLTYNVLNRLIHRELLNEAVDQLGVLTPDEILRAEINKIPGFQNANKQFDREKFRSVLINQGMTEQQFVKIFQQESNRQQLLGILQHLNELIEFPDFMAHYYYQWMHAPRVIKIVQFKDQEMLVNSPVTEEVLQDFYNRESRYFVEPEMRDVTVMWLDPKKRAAHIIIDEETIEQYYKENPKLFTTQERRKVQYYDFTALEEAEAFLTNEPSKNKGTPQVITPNMFSAEVAAHLFSLAVDAYSPPLQANSHYRIYKILAVEPVKPLPLNAVKQTIKEKLQLERNQDALHEDIKLIDDALASGTAFEDVIKNYSLESKNIKNIADIDQLVDQLPSGFVKEIATQLFTLHQGDVSPFIVVPTGEYIALVVSKVVPKRQPELREIKEKVADSWMKKEHQKQADKRANALIDSMNKGASLEEAASQDQKKVQIVEVNFTKPSEKVGSEVLKALVSLTPGQSAAVRSSEMTTVVYLDKIEKISPNNNQLKELKQNLKEAWMEDILNGYLESIRRHAQVRIHQPLVQAVVESVKS